MVTSVWLVRERDEVRERERGKRNSAVNPRRLLPPDMRPKRRSSRDNYIDG